MHTDKLPFPEAKIKQTNIILQLCTSNTKEKVDRIKNFTKDIYPAKIKDVDLFKSVLKKVKHDVDFLLTTYKQTSDYADEFMSTYDGQYFEKFKECSDKILNFDMTLYQ